MRGIHQIHGTRQQRTDPLGGLIDEYLGIVAHDRVHSLLGDLRRADFRDVKSLGGIGVQWLSEPFPHHFRRISLLAKSHESPDLMKVS